MTLLIDNCARTIRDHHLSQGNLGMAAAWRDGWRGMGAACAIGLTARA